ncbi:MAG: penicillin-binding protein 1C [Burkholderiales bacterium]
MSTFVRWRQVAVCVAACALLAAFWGCLPQPLFNASYSPVLLSREGGLMSARLAQDGQWRFYAHSAVPEKFRAALVRFEDKRFAWHPGVDPLAAVRALYLNVKHGQVVSGGSTLTMQVIRLARGPRERTLWEKCIEAMMALRLEITRGKDEIFALYSAHAPFGGNIVGLEAAAWRYFGRAPDKLSWAEAAALAVLPNSPALIHPGKNRDRWQSKRDRLLRALSAAGHLNATDLSLAMAEPLPSAARDLPRLAPHLLDTLAIDAAGNPVRFHSTLVASVQIDVQGIVDQHLETLRRQEIKNAAAIVLNNESFDVLAYVSNSSKVASDEPGQAVDIVRRPRSTGSTLKPFLYAAMLDAGEILPSTLVPDLPTQYGGFVPENFERTFQGAVPAKYALARSLNVPAVRMLKMHGVAPFHAALRNLGLTSLDGGPDRYGLTLILGGAEATLWDLAGAYANLAHIAARVAPRAPCFYRHARVLRAEQTRARAVPCEISPGSAWLTMSALQEVNRPDAEKNWKNFSSSTRIAWKTGTSFGQRDGWAIGSDARHTVAVWVGNASGEGRADLTGASSAAPILFAIFNRLGAGPWFRKPEADLKEEIVCKDDGFLAHNGCSARSELAPLAGKFERASPYHRVVHLDDTARWQVHGDCESPRRMRHETWFVLPPGQEFYYRKHHADYRPLPPFRAGCTARMSAKHNPIEFIYPNFGTRLYVPTELGGKRSRTVFEATHRDGNAILYWHVDEQYLGATSTFHQQALDIEAGPHVITVVDQQGNRLSRQFEVLALESKR